MWLLVTFSSNLGFWDAHPSGKEKGTAFIQIFWKEISSVHLGVIPDAFHDFSIEYTLPVN